LGDSRRPYNNRKRLAEENIRNGSEGTCRDQHTPLTLTRKIQVPEEYETASRSRDIWGSNQILRRRSCDRRTEARAHPLRLLYAGQTSLRRTILLRERAGKARGITHTSLRS